MSNGTEKGTAFPPLLILKQHVLHLHSFLLVVLFAIAGCAVELTYGAYAAGAPLSTFILPPFAQQVRLKLTQVLVRCFGY
jgi:hypothetical protein